MVLKSTHCRLIVAPCHRLLSYHKSFFSHFIPLQRYIFLWNKELDRCHSDVRGNITQLWLVSNNIAVIEQFPTEMSSNIICQIYKQIIIVLWREWRMICCAYASQNWNGTGYIYKEPTRLLKLNKYLFKMKANQHLLQQNQACGHISIIIELPYCMRARVVVLWVMTNLVLPQNSMHKN